MADSCVRKKSQERDDEEDEREGGDSLEMAVNEGIGPTVQPALASEELEVQADESGDTFIEVTCGNAVGNLYLKKFSESTGGKQKCVLHNGRLVTPSEFEALGGKKASKAWKKSIKHKGKPLFKLIESLAERSALPNPLAPTTNPRPENPTATASVPHGVDGLFQEMEEKLTSVLQGVIKEAINSLKRSFEQQIHSLEQHIEGLSRRLTSLEQSREPASESQTVSARNETEFSSLKTQLEQVTESLKNQQKLLESKERENRSNNLIITGIQESSTETENTTDVVTTFLSDDLGLTDIAIVKTRRLGKKQAQRARPILLTLDSSTTKGIILAKRVALAGSKIYINPDLTKEQRQAEKRLRDLKKQLIQLPEYRNKRVSIYRGKLHVDRIPVSSAELQAAGISE